MKKLLFIAMLIASIGMVFYGFYANDFLLTTIGFVCIIASELLAINEDFKPKK